MAPDIYEAQCYAGQAPCAGWPRASALLSWRTRGDVPAPIEISNLSIEPAQARPD
jgi:hypothetical protein